MFIERVDVLNKVKELFLLPTMEMMSTQMFAEFYEATVTAIKNLYVRNKEEIDTDDVKSTRRNEIKDFTSLKMRRVQIRYILTLCKHRGGSLRKNMS